MKKDFLFTRVSVVSVFVLMALVSSLIIISCNKEGKKEGSENPCPVIAATAVPQVVKDSFAIRYPSMTVNTWFQKDSIGYCAYFIQPVNQKKLAEFSRTGAFISEEIDLDHDGNFEDSTGHSGTKVSGVCECEIPDGK